MHKRILSTFNRTKSQENRADRALPDGDSPEATVARGVRLFCESGGPNNSGDEVLHLPTIVESAESSPAAASEAAHLIRKLLSKDSLPRAYVQYNAIMLVRILADNPGRSFTRNIDNKFVTTVKELLREGRDMSVQQILRETLDNFETAKPNDETLAALREMWKKEKDKMFKRGSMGPGVPMNRLGPPPPPGTFAHQQAQQQNYFSRPHRQRNTLPPPAELAQRIEEARTSAKLLSQVVATTPPTEIIHNELIKEFVERCQSASRSVQAYIHADSPPPDEDTLLTLIETNDVLASAMSKHQRALLDARKKMGAPSPSNPTGPYEAPSDLSSLPPAGLAPSRGGGRVGQEQFPAPAGPPPGRKPVDDNQDPFGDHNEAVLPGMPDLQAPLQPQSYGLPPQSIFHKPQQQQQPNGGGVGRMDGVADSSGVVVGGRGGGAGAATATATAYADREVVEQPAKPKYRF